MKTKTFELAEQIKSINGAKFVSLTYRSKGTNELARYTVIIGFSYNTLVEKSVTELEILFPTLVSPIEKIAGEEVMASLKKTLDAHSRGEQNADYTKIDQYIHIANGLSLNSTDNTLQLFGLLHSKVTLEEGTYKKVNSAEKTIVKNKIKENLSVSKFREFSLDIEQIDSVRINGETIEFVPSLSTMKTTEVDLIDHTKKDSVSVV